MSDGPKLTVVASCLTCKYERSERYAVQGDSGQNVYCDHPATMAYVGDTTWATPKWCPLYPDALAALLASAKEST